MPISNYTTKVDSMSSVAEIQKVLMNHDADRVMIEYLDKMPVALTFQVNTVKGVVSFKLPANIEGVLNALKKDKAVPTANKNSAQALKVAWRILLNWVEAQMAIVEAEMATVDQVFMPYALLQSGNTVYQEFSQDKLIQLQ
jgi:hypothetical protein